VRVLAIEEEGDDVVPHGRGAGDTGGDVAHGSVVVVADPGGDEEVFGVTESPVVAKVVGSAGFDSDLVVGNIENGVGTEGGASGLIVGEDVGDLVGDARVENARLRARTGGSGDQGGGA